MDTLTIDGEEALVISDERKRAPRRRIGPRAFAARSLRVSRSCQFGLRSQ